MFEKSKISIVIADDHPMVLKGLYNEFNENNYNVVGKAKDGMQALEEIVTHKPVIALLDIDMPLLTGFEVIKIAKEKGIDTKFIILSFHKESEYISKAQVLQINGYLLKEDSFSEIERCINAVLKDETYFSSSFSPSSISNASEELIKLKRLTPSEKTILKLIAKQLSSNQIAEQLYVSVRTVEKHRSNIILKLNLESHTANALSIWANSNRTIINEL
ncbi:MAG: DNA-binding response regulator [Aequorivita sp.]|nr:DNA-binding response regulator [Aequorivita sp.]|tara:strand:- start:89722 stop:90375 length:654 start_codon:yes stop_codon:yes gene_type:complete